MPFRLPPLPWEKSVVKGFMSAHQIDDHYVHHHKVYVDTLNDLIKGTVLARCTLEEILELTGGHHGDIYRNAAQHYLHTLFWNSVGPESETPQPVDENTPLPETLQAVVNTYEEFTECCDELFGSGWVAITYDGEDIDVCCIRNAKYCPEAIVVIDMWEHSYYIDYEYRKSEYVAQFWKHLNWDFVKQQLEEKENEAE